MDKSNIDKVKLESSNIADENFEKLASLFPNVVTETIVNDRVERVIDVYKLKQEINSHVVEGLEERYNFSWPDKRKSVVLANAPTRNTLRACKEESKDFDKTENLYIEGDNLEVLKLLRNTYLGQVKMIYIDPPYNTGKDFVYQDNFYINKEEYKENSGQFDEEGNRLFENTEANGRFHTDWLNMMYPRLKMARDLLTDDGVIFISIDDNEVSNLRKICDDIFGEKNFIAQIIWERAFAPVNLKKHFSVSHDYLLFYSKNIELSVCNGLSRSQETNDRYSNPDNDPRGPWTSGDLSVGPAVESNIYEIITPNGRSCLPPNGKSWRVSKDKYYEMLEDNCVWFGEDGNGVPRYKRFLKDVKNSVTPMSIWKYTDVGHSQEATKELKILFDDIHVFDYSKSVELIKRGISLYSDKNSLILDFFSGSATTAHAVMQLNAENGGGIGNL